MYRRKGKSILVFCCFFHQEVELPQLLTRNDVLDRAKRPRYRGESLALTRTQSGAITTIVGGFGSISLQDIPDRGGDSHV